MTLAPPPRFRNFVRGAAIGSLAAGLLLAAAGWAQTPPAAPASGNASSSTPASGTATGIPLPRITFSRSFQGSNPEFFQIQIGRNGAGQFLERGRPQDPGTALAFTLPAPDVKAIFDLAASLHEFAQPALQSKAKVAYTGQKTLAYDSPQEHHAQSFTYTRVAAAARLRDYFEKMGLTGIDAVQLLRAVRFEPLSVLEKLDQMQDAWTNHQLAAPEIMIPVLEKTAADPSLMQAARQRAATLAAHMRASTGAGQRP